MEKVRKKKKRKINELTKEIKFLGAGLTLVFLILSLVFTFILFRSGLLPISYVIATTLVLLSMTAFIFYLMYFSKKKLFYILGLIFFCLSVIPLIYGTVAISRVKNTLETIATPNAEVTKVGIYVLKDDLAQNLTDLNDQTFGVLYELEETSTDKAVEMIKSESKITLTTTEYPGLTSLIDSLYNKESRAIILNTAYLDILEETEGYTDVREKIREIAVFNIEEKLSYITKDAAYDQPFTLYISGIDSRNGLVANSRSDVNILATINPNTKQILLVTTPRDFYVPLPNSNGANDKLTHAGIYGVENSMGTLSMLYGLDNLDYYFRISFEGTVAIVNALGGVTVTSSKDFSSSGYHFISGNNDIDGKAALVFARERYSFEDGDRQRGKNQTALVKAIISKASSPEILMNYSTLLTAMEGNFETNMPYSMISSLVSEQLKDGKSWEVLSYSVNGTGATEVPYSLGLPAYVMIPDQSTVDTAKTAIEAVLNGEKISQPY